VALRVAGERESADPVVEAEVDLDDGEAYTIAGLGPADELRAAVFEDDLSAPAVGAANVRVIHAALGTGRVDVEALGGPQLARDVAFAKAARYTMVPPGRYGIAVSDADGTRLVSVPDVDFGSGIVYSVVVIGGAGQPLQIVPLVDARGAEVLPAGGVNTGGGGTAGAGDALGTPWLVAVVAAAVLLGVVVLGRVTRGRARTA
jgi:hypothetical protein